MNEEELPARFWVPSHIWETENLTGSAYKLYFYLCFLRSQRFHFPSYSHLCLKLGMNRNTLASSIKALKKAGLISYKKGNSFQNLANKYKVIDQLPAKSVQ